MARTKVIATIGPACRSTEMLEKMVMAGMDVARINCSHADHDSIASIVVDIREISQRLDRAVGVLLDFGQRSAPARCATVLSNYKRARPLL